MKDQPQHSLLDVETRIRRSKGRSGRTISATARVTRGEQNEMEAAAKQKGQSLSEWCREVLLAAAREDTITPTFTEIVAIRQLLNSTLRNVACGVVMTPEAFQTELQVIRSSKHKAAAEVMQQYVASEAGQ
jgi:hypothetical protein